MNNEANITKRDQAGPLAESIFEADAGAGISNIKQDDLALPFLKVLGQLSPECNKRGFVALISEYACTALA